MARIARLRWSLQVSADALAAVAVAQAPATALRPVLHFAFLES